MSQTRLDELNMLVSEAIHAAENDMHEMSGHQRAAYRRVSEIEAEIAELIPVDLLEGAVARMGAVRAAVNAGDMARASELVEKYVAAGISDTLKNALRALLS